MSIQRKRYYELVEQEKTTGIVYVFDYIIGIVFFGIVYLILNTPIAIIDRTLGPSVTNSDWAMFLWFGSLVIYLIFGAFYFLTKLREE